MITSVQKVISLIYKHVVVTKILHVFPAASLGKALMTSKPLVSWLKSAIFAEASSILCKACQLNSMVLVIAVVLVVLVVILAIMLPRADLEAVVALFYSSVGGDIDLPSYPNTHGHSSFYAPGRSTS